MLGASSHDRLWAAVREIQRDGPSAFLPMWDSGIQAVEQVAGSANAALSGTLQVQSPGPMRGATSQAIRFAGGQGLGSWVLGTTCTLSFWIYWEASSGDTYAQIIGTADGAIALYVMSTGKLDLFYVGTDHQTASAGVRKNGWTHVMVSISAGVATFYFNGVKDTVAPTAFPGGTFTTIGTNTTPEALTGSLAFLAIYPTALTQARATAHFESLVSANSFDEAWAPVVAAAAATGTPVSLGRFPQVQQINQGRFPGVF